MRSTAGLCENFNPRSDPYKVSCAETHLLTPTSNPAPVPTATAYVYKHYNNSPTVGDNGLAHFDNNNLIESSYVLYGTTGTTRRASPSRTLRDNNLDVPVPQPNALGLPKLVNNFDGPAVSGHDGNAFVSWDTDKTPSQLVCINRNLERTTIVWGADKISRLAIEWLRQAGRQKQYM